MFSTLHLEEKTLPVHCISFHSILAVFRTHTSFRMLEGSALPPIIKTKSATKEAV
jgi:hypothetical protein